MLIVISIKILKYSSVFNTLKYLLKLKFVKLNTYVSHLIYKLAQMFISEK